VRDLESFEGTTVHYWASPSEAKLCEGQEVALVGGGNSAGQAVAYLADHAARILLLARRPLEETMSAYLVERLTGLSNVEIVIGAEVSALEGSAGELTAVRWRDRRSGAEGHRPIRQLFLFIGAEPNTDWLDGCGLELDERGFVRTGGSCTKPRLPLETSRGGVFAVGDVRAGSVKRVASAVGDGAQVVAALHTYLARPRAGADPAPRRDGLIPRQLFPSTRRDHMAARDEIREDMEVIGADGVHLGTVDRIEGDRLKLVKADSGQGGHRDHHHYLSLGLVAAVEGNKVRLSANADNAALFEEEQDGSAA
jgi:thioredoxin reductase (NADPH)